MGIDLDALRKKHQELENKGGGTNYMDSFYQIPEGVSYVRLLPPKDEETGLFYAETKIHRIELPGDEKRNVHCRKIHNEPCPLCDAYYELWNVSKANKEDWKTGDYAQKARSIKPRSRFYMNVVDRNEGGVKIFSVGEILFKKIVNIMLDEDIGDITDLKTGRDFKIVRNRKGEWPDYSESNVRIKQEAAGSDKEIAEWMDSLHNIQGLVKLEEFDSVLKYAQHYLPSLATGVGLEEDEVEDTSNDFNERVEV
tara:strand:+ start:217 stop:975 length:759 start_codon:yes stop_codon:yes gene_type:complete